MSPKTGEEVFLTELETDILHPFVKRKILNDRHIAVVLMELADKLEGRYGKESTDK